MGICGSVDEGDVASDQKNQTGKDGQRGSLKFPPGLAPKEYVFVFEPNENTKYSHTPRSHHNREAPPPPRNSQTAQPTNRGMVQVALK